MASPGSEVADEPQWQGELDEAVAKLNATCANPVATPSPTRDGEMDGISEYERASSRAPIRPIVSPASVPDPMPIGDDGEQDQVPDRVFVIAEGSVGSVQDVVADVPSSQQDATMGGTIVDQLSVAGDVRSGQADAMVQDLRQINVVWPQIGRVAGPSATAVFGEEKLTLQLRDMSADPKTWAALEWVIRARPPVVDLASRHEALRTLFDEISKMVAIKDAPESELLGISDILTCNSDYFEPDGCLAPAYRDAEAQPRDQVLEIKRMCVPKAAFPVYLGGGKTVKAELAPGEIQIEHLGQGSLHTADTASSRQGQVLATEADRRRSVEEDELPEFDDDEGASVPTPPPPPDASGRRSTTIPPPPTTDNTVPAGPGMPDMPPIGVLPP